MNEINLTFKKNNKGKHVFTIVQNGEELFSREYTVNYKKHQDTLFTGFVNFLQEEANIELKENPDFKWLNIKEFKSWVTAYRKDTYLDRIDKDPNRYL